jgi:UDP-N-acetylmuramate dehydrogenase
VVSDALLKQLEAIAPTKRDEPLSRHTTIGIGGPADAFVSPASAEQMRDVLALAHEAGEPVFVLGSGSNIVIGDRGIRGVTIDNRATNLAGPFECRGEHLTPQPPLRPHGEGGPSPGLRPASGQGSWCWRAEAGCSFAGVARQLSFAGYKGMEWACGIPGTIGGAVVYNAGAYGGCLGDVLLRIGAWDAANGETVIEADELGLVYRGSAFTRGVMAGKAVLWAEFALWPGDAEELRARIADYDARRLKAQPRGRNAGSFFKNPPEQPAWKLLDAVGMRGYRIGGAQFSEKHCNFLINAGDATAADVAALKREAQTRVRSQLGVELENEVTLVGEGFGDA